MKFKKILLSVLTIFFVMTVSVMAGKYSTIFIDGKDVTKYGTFLYGKDYSAYYTPKNHAMIFNLNYKYDSKKRTHYLTTKDYKPKKDVAVNQVVQHGPLKLTFKKITFDYGYKHKKNDKPKKSIIIQLAVANTSSETIYFRLSEIGFIKPNKEAISDLYYEFYDAVTKEFTSPHADYLANSEKQYLIVIDEYMLKDVTMLSVFLPSLKNDDYADMQKFATYDVKFN